MDPVFIAGYSAGIFDSPKHASPQRSPSPAQRLPSFPSFPQTLLSPPQRSPSPSVLPGLHSPQRLPSPAGQQGLLQSPQRPRSPAVLRPQVLKNNRRCTTRKELEERRPPARKTGPAATLQNASNAAEKYYQVNKNFIFILDTICYI